MQIAIHAVGRMKAGPERELSARYLERLAKLGPSLGLDYTGLREIPESRAAGAPERKADESSKLEAAAAGGLLVLLDETGRDIGSEEFAEWIGARRDAGAKAVTFAIGGADGHDPAVRKRAALVVRFGRQTWPHQLVRIMLAEQLYRAMTILAGHPYHRA